VATTSNQHGLYLTHILRKKNFFLYLYDDDESLMMMLTVPLAKSKSSIYGGIGWNRTESCAQIYFHGQH